MSNEDDDDRLKNGEHEDFEDFEDRRAADEEPEGKDKPGDDDEFEDAEDYSKKVRKRIGKAIYERNVAREELQAERAARLRLQQELEQAKGGKRADDDGDDLASRRADLKRQIAEALGDGDIEKGVDLQEQLAEVIAEQRERQRAPKAPSGKEAQRPKQHPSAVAWVERNPWVNQKGNAGYAERALDVQRELLDEGYSFSDQFWEELDRRLDAAYPTVKLLRTDNYYNRDAKGDDEPKDEPRRRNTPPLAASPRIDEGRHTPRAGKLTDQDVRSMKKYGLDPKNPEHRKSWLAQGEEL